jgi:hypothetical protein
MTAWALRRASSAARDARSHAGPLDRLTGAPNVAGLRPGYWHERRGLESGLLAEPIRARPEWKIYRDGGIGFER